MAALIHAAIDEEPKLDAVKKAIEELVADPMVPLAEDNGRYRFISEKLRDIDAERGNIPRKSSELKRIRNEALREVFDPLPEIKFRGSMSVRAGLKVQTSGIIAGLPGEGNDIQIVVEFAALADLDAVKARLVDDSRSKVSQTWIYLAAHADTTLDDLAGEAWQSTRIAELHQSDPDPEVREYCRNQDDRVHGANGLIARLRQAIRSSLEKAAFIFQGRLSAVTTLDSALAEATKKILKEAAEIVFSRYDEAPERVDTQVAEKVLRLTNLTGITTALDPLGLIPMAGGRPTVNAAHKAIVSLKDHLERFGSRDGKSLTEIFSSPPFGWSPDTLRYILAAMLVGGMIQLKVAGSTVTTSGQHAIEALKTNKSFLSNVSVALRDNPVTIADLARAAERVSGLTGQAVNPLENEICLAVQKQFPRLQGKVSALAERLRSIGAPGSERAKALSEEVGNSSSTMPRMRPAIWVLPRQASSSPCPGPPRSNRRSTRGSRTRPWGSSASRVLSRDFPELECQGPSRQRSPRNLAMAWLGWRRPTSIGTRPSSRSSSTGLEGLVRNAADKLAETQRSRITEARIELLSLPEFKEFMQEQQSSYIAQLEALGLETTSDLAGFEERLARDFDIGSTVDALRAAIRMKGQEIIRIRVDEERKRNSTFVRKTPIKARLSSVQDVQRLISELSKLKDEAAYFASVDITLELKE